MNMRPTHTHTHINTHIRVSNTEGDRSAECVDGSAFIRGSTVMNDSDQFLVCVYLYTSLYLCTIQYIPFFFYYPAGFS